MGGLLTGAFHLTEIPEILLKIKKKFLECCFFNFEEFDPAAQISSFGIRRNKSRLEALKWSRTRHFGFGGGFCSSKAGKQQRLGRVLIM
jgi:hypothetical protein